jgi:hypothetical protein
MEPEKKRLFAVKLDLIIGGFESEIELKAFVAAIAAAAQIKGLDVEGHVAVLSNMPLDESDKASSAKLDFGKN